MKKIGVLVKNHSSIILKDQQWESGKVLKTRRYIPGVYLRGAITDQLLQGRSYLNRCFDQLFCDPHRWGMEIVFPNCYPNLNAYTFPMLLPITAKSCKWKPGFVQDTSFDEQHGVFDTLLNQVIFRQVLASSTQSGRPSRSLSLIRDAYYRLIEQGTLYCSTCHGIADSYQVEYAKPHGNFREIPVRTYCQPGSVLTFARNRTEKDTSTDQRGRFIEFISERTWFLGFSFLPADPSLIGLYKDSLESITHLGEIGNQETGRVEVKVREIEDHELSLRQRVLKLNQKYRQMQKEYSVHQPDMLITVNLQSEIILRDRNGKPATRLDSSFLREELQRVYRRIAGEDLPLQATICQEVISFSRPVYVEGWYSRGKSTDKAVPAIARGSVFVFSFPGGISPKVFQALEHLEKSGIGENRGEGYGQILICDPFHLEVPAKSS
ncbi:MAG: type III-B CRISPR module-associated Cmr3 family protein [bacterium]